MSLIHFKAVGVPHSFRNKPRLVRLIRRIARDHDRIIGSISFVLLSDSALLSVNERFLKRNYYTDVITFGYGRGLELSGEVLISHDRTRDNAKHLVLSHQAEIRRIMVHGVLHLIGYDDRTAIQRREMTSAEDRYLALF